MDILKNGFVLKNVNEVSQERDISYLHSITKLFPIIEKYKSKLLTSRITSNYFNKVNVNMDSYTYDDGLLIKQKIRDSKQHCAQTWNFIDEYTMCLANGFNSEKQKEYVDFFNRITLDIINAEYDGFNFTSTDIKSKGNVTYYEKDDFIEMHTDGLSESRLCVILLYLNENWKEGDGGELVLNNKNNELVAIVPPKIGDYVVLDFTKNNLSHGVNAVMGDFKRFTYVHFVEISENANVDILNKFEDIKNKNIKL
jgi:Rps23 Pro-64 3,4-dihydroxylase Tpa1-like proline 4-hydroxylase